MNKQEAKKKPFETKVEIKSIALNRGWTIKCLVMAYTAKEAEEIGINFYQRLISYKESIPCEKLEVKARSLLTHIGQVLDDRSLDDLNIQIERDLLGEVEDEIKKRKNFDYKVMKNKHE